MLEPHAAEILIMGAIDQATITAVMIPRLPILFEIPSDGRWCCSVT